MYHCLYILKIATLLVLSVNFSGCVPFPHYATSSPSVIGKVHKSGKPIENAIVYLEHPVDERCTFESDVLTYTNSKGQFQFELRKEFQFFITMDPWQNWQVCITEGDDRYQGWYQNVLGGSPQEIRFDCDLNSSIKVEHIGNSMGKTMGVCSVQFEE